MGVSYGPGLVAGFLLLAGLALGLTLLPRPSPPNPPPRPSPSPSPGGSLPAEVIVVAGGYNEASRLSSVSAHLPGRPACRLPSLPAALADHTLDSVAGRPTVCGGWYRNGNTGRWSTAQTCLQLQGSSWRQVTTLQEGRMDHYSWLLPEGLLLLGGYSSRTTELAVATGDRQPAYSFTMDTQRIDSCSIETPDGLVITGGEVGGEFSSRRVTRLSPAGRPTELPGLGTGREHHGCGRVTIGQQEVLVVAGGWGAGFELLASTEVLVAGSPAWVAAGRLPSARVGLRGASLGGRLFMAGGMLGRGDKYITAQMLEFNGSDNTWVTAPPMDEARYGHAMATVPYTAVQRFCTKW